MGLTSFLLFANFDFPFQQPEHRFLFYTELLLIYQVVTSRKGPGTETLFRIGRIPVFTLIGSMALITSLMLAGDYHSLKSIRMDGKQEYQSALDHIGRIPQRIYDITPVNFPIDYIAGKVKIKQGQYSQALPLVEGSLLINPYDPRILNDYGMLLNQSGRTKESIKALREALILAPYYEEARFNLAAVYYFEKMYLPALKILESLPDSPKKKEYIKEIQSK